MNTASQIATDALGERRWHQGAGDCETPPAISNPPRFEGKPNEVPSLFQVGVLRTVDDEVAVLFGACPGETVQRVELNLTDDKFEEIVRVLWAIEAGGDDSSEDVFLVGQLPSGFREITPLDGPPQPGDHVQVVVTTNDRGTIPMSFTVDDLKTNEVLVRQDQYRSRVEFDDQVDDGCRS